MNAFIYQTQIAPLLLVENNGTLVEVSFRAPLPNSCVHKETPLLKEAFRQLQEYFCGRRKTFDLPLSAKGTVFQQKVWQALQTIPYGQVASYKDIAVRVGNPKACRAVGMANHNNPIGIIIPCHRVVGTDGKLTGYAGGVDIKEKLLALEKHYS